MIDNEPNIHYNAVKDLLLNLIKNDRLIIGNSKDGSTALCTSIASGENGECVLLIGEFE
jgi:hypothetical protein